MARQATKLRTVETILDESDNERARIGGNNPPPHEAWTTHVGDLMDEARSFLDGANIENEAQATDVARLLDAFRKAGKDADAARAEEKKPHDDAAKAVQARWKPLLDQCTLAADTCKRALTPWLRAKEDEQRRIADEARKEAERLAEEAHRKHDAAIAGGLAEREDAERAIKDAERARATATKLDKATPNATGGERAVGLRTVYRAEITDPRALLNHYAKTRRDDLVAWLQSQADKDVRAKIHTIPGVTVHEDKEAV